VKLTEVINAIRLSAR